MQKHAHAIKLDQRKPQSSHQIHDLNATMLPCNKCTLLSSQLTNWWVRWFVSLFVRTHSPAVQQGMKRLLLSVARQAAQPMRACTGVYSARLPLRQSTSQAAATAGLLHQLTAHRGLRTHGERLLIARLARNIRASTDGQRRQKCTQHKKSHTSFQSE